MITRNYTISYDVLKVLQGLAYWSAQESFQMEHDSSDAHELERITKTIHCLFAECDRKEIAPLLVNQALYFGSCWRVYMNQYFIEWAKSRGIIINVAGVSA